MAPKRVSGADAETAVGGDSTIAGVLANRPRRVIRT